MNLFDVVHRHNLVYNTCWEDPRLDREALALGPQDTVLAITSAGCNVLDYALDAPERIHAVDLNPRQTALLELKMAGIRSLEHDDFLALFGQGRHAQWADVYRNSLRPHLSPWSARFWDRHGHVFSGHTRRGSFYFHGTSGLVAWGVQLYLRHVARRREAIDALLDAKTLDTQRDVYERLLRPHLFSRSFQWVLQRSSLLALLAVPEPQRRHLEQDHAGGIADFIIERLDQVFTTIPLSDNYFWRVYLQGHYDRISCPLYLQPGPFAQLKAGLVDRITLHTMSVEACLRSLDHPVTALVLLDHMDWLCGERSAALQHEWQAIVDRSAPDARVIWRSGGTHTDFVNTLQVRVRDRVGSLGEHLTYAPALTDALHQRDRVCTYGSFHLAQLSC